MRTAISLLLAVVLGVFSFSASTGAQGRTSLEFVLNPFLGRYDLPALAAAVIKGGRIIAVGATGTRQAGTKTIVTLSDRFHIGSDTKAMTALLGAMMVEQVKRRWDSTVGEVFPELAGTMNSGLKAVTFQQLLSHTGGIAADNDAFGKLLERSLTQEGNLDEVRYWLVKEMCTTALVNQPGTTFLYSNMGYVLAGAMIERVSGCPWEELMIEQVFRPLKFTSAGLGCQATLGKIDAPLGHVVVDGKVKAMLAGPNCDNPAVIGPAGIAHMSLLDFARWAGWNAGGGKRRPNLVKAATLEKLHTPVISMPEKKDAAPGTPSHGRYALGWGEVTVEWAPRPLLYHGGSNGKNLAQIWIDKKRDLAIVTMTNIGGAKANEGLLALARQLYAGFAQ
jgi:CubicO group peptidase (beta-lactamase class C family)